MGVYVTATLETGVRIGWMEIGRDPDPKVPPHSMEPRQHGVFPYHFRYNGQWGRGTVGGEGVLHERSHDVWELVRAVLNHSEPTRLYCGSCHCQFVPVSEEEIAQSYIDGSTFYRRVEVAE